MLTYVIQPTLQYAHGYIKTWPWQYGENLIEAACSLQGVKIITAQSLIF